MRLKTSAWMKYVMANNFIIFIKSNPSLVSMLYKFGTTEGFDPLMI